MSGDDRDGRRHAAVRDRDPGRCGRRERRRHAGDDLEPHAGIEQCLSLLATATEHVRIAAFQPHDGPVVLGEGDEERADQLLGHTPTRTLADVDQLGCRVDDRQHAVADKGIVDDHVGLGEQPGGAHRQQVRVSWTCADQMNGHG